MEKQVKVSIGIQARSNSTRFPNKVTQMVGGKMVIDHVIDLCRNSAEYINRYTFTNKTVASVYVLVPEGDPLKQILSTMSERVLEGSESDVLSRYMKLAKETDASYVVRITADCPLIPPFLVFKCINTAIKNGLDYFSNVGDFPETLRTSVDGHDVEVLSIRALEWLDQNATKPEHREHVTTLLRKDDPPQSLRFGILIGHNDHSNVKLSLDTEEDLENIRSEVERVQKKIQSAKRKYGKHAIHRY